MGSPNFKKSRNIIMRDLHDNTLRPVGWSCSFSKRFRWAFKVLTGRRCRRESCRNCPTLVMGFATNGTKQPNIMPTVKNQCLLTASACMLTPGKLQPQVAASDFALEVRHKPWTSPKRCQPVLPLCFVPASFDKCSRNPCRGSCRNPKNNMGQSTGGPWGKKNNVAACQTSLHVIHANPLLQPGHVATHSSPQACVLEDASHGRCQRLQGPRGQVGLRQNAFSRPQGWECRIQHKERNEVPGCLRIAIKSQGPDA